MAYHSIVLRGRQALELDQEGWNELPTRRGRQADLYDSRAWLASWLAVAGEDAARRLIVAAVLEGDRPVALLPLLERSGGIWESAGQGLRPRYRPVVDAEQPPGEPLALLASAALRAGLRELRLPALPARDPATELFLNALREEGLHVATREGASDCLTTVSAGWEEHRGEFRRFHRNAREKANKARRLGVLDLELYGAGGSAILEGFRLYREVHARSWKGELAERTRKHRGELLRQTDPLGWPRLFVLRLAGVPVAAHIWFRLGEVALSYSTVYDGRIRALSPGTVLQWQGQERIFSEQPPRILDFLPGRGAQKEELGRERTPLVNLVASKRRFVAPLADMARRGVRSTARGLRGLRPAERGKERADIAETEQVTGRVIAPSGPAGASERVDPDNRLLLYLAVAGGHATTKAMRGAWGEGETWWRVDGWPPAFVRVVEREDDACEVRELVLPAGHPGTVESILATLAAALGSPVRISVADKGGSPGRTTPVHRAPLPYPD